MRVGQNPLKRKEAPAHFPPVLLAVITHLPNTEGYHAQRFEIIKRCLASLYEADKPILVWDNGSSSAIREWLKSECEYEYLILSPNIGKKAARAAIMRMTPPDTIVAISDDDMLFEAGWLEASLDLLNTFPNVGAVSAYPVRFGMKWGNEQTLKWAHQHATVEAGQFIPDKWTLDWAQSIGYKEIQPRWRTQDDYRITYQGRQAYATAQHCQFVCRAGTIASLCEYTLDAVGEEQSWDCAIDAAGLLRLTTTQRYARHLGNVME